MVLSDNAIVSNVCHRTCNLNDKGLHNHPTPEEIKAADVVLTTLHNACRLMSIASPDGTFNKKVHWVILDEAAFSRESDTIIPIVTQLFIRKLEGDPTKPKVVLLGDTRQIQFKSKALSLRSKQKDKTWDSNLLERLKSMPVYKENSDINITLRQNYRNPSNVCTLLGKTYKEGEIIPMSEKNATISCTHVDSSLELGVHSSSAFSKPAALKAVELAKGVVGTTYIVCFYKAQELLLNKLLEKSGSEVDHVRVTCTEGYQGQEAQNIIVCPTMKRLNCAWVGDEARIGMTISRTIESLHLVGNLRWLSRIHYMRDIIRYSMDQGTVHAAESTKNIIRGHLYKVPKHFV